MKGARIAIYVLIIGLIVSLFYFGSRLPVELENLSTVQSDETQWSVSQLETEVTLFVALLNNEVHLENPDITNIRLRAEIVLSRINLSLTSQRQEKFEDVYEAAEIFSMLRQYSKDVIAIIDHSDELMRGEIAKLQELTENVRPVARQMSLGGLAVATELAEARRTHFAEQLRQIGWIAITLIACLLFALLYLDRLLFITRRQDAEIEAKTQRLVSTSAASLDAIIMADKNDVIVEYNEAAQIVFGWEAEEKIGCTVAETIVPDRFRKVYRHGFLERVLSDEGNVDKHRVNELPALRRTGEEFPVEVRVATAKQDGDILLIAAIRDISERKINEKKLIDARRQAEATDRAKSRFLAVMSHEMRTPLNGILGVLDLLKTTGLNSRQQRFVSVAAASGQVLLEHINEALDVTRIEAAGMVMTPQAFSLKEVVLRTVDVLQPLAGEKHLDLAVEFDPVMDRHFHADHGRISQILTNLVGNAIKFTQQGQIILKVTGIHGPGVTQTTITVEDTGPGIAEAHLEDIFEDFFVIGNAAGRQSRGDGLGLSISRKVARMMGGDLTVSSQEGQGSQFSLTLTLERVEIPQASRLSAIPEDDEGTKSVLVVEDNAVNRSVLREMLESFGHYVVEADNGAKGLETAKERPFDLIIMDISMPEMDGLEATAQIRACDGPNIHTTIFGLTAHGEEEYRLKAKSAGMTDFYTKPLRLGKLQQLLKSRPNDNDVSEDTDRTDDIHDVQIASELMNVLGVDKTKASFNRFFGELEEGIASIRRGQSDTSISVNTAETLHRLRGAAALLGCTDLIRHIDSASHVSKGETGDPCFNSLTQLEQSIPMTRATVEALIEARRAEDANIS